MPPCPDTTLATPLWQPTQHAMLVIWGRFARELGLLDQLATVPIPEKTVRHTAAA